MGFLCSASHQVWPDQHLHYVGLDSSRAMQAISSVLLAQIPAPSLRTKLFQTSIGSPGLQETITSTFPDIPDSETMAVAAYTLGDLPSDKARREVVADLWESGAEVIVVIDRGTPRGFDIVATAREQLLRLGKHERAAVETVTNESVTVVTKEVTEEDEDILELDGLTYYAEGSEQAKLAFADGQGCYIVAPVRRSAPTSSPRR
jgi:ribosomal protein RSM22 (predicted rRNA methylase)